MAPEVESQIPSCLAAVGPEVLVWGEGLKGADPGWSLVA